MRTSSKNRDRGKATANRDGDDLPTEAITIYVTPSDSKTIREAAKKERLSLSAYARRSAVQSAERDTGA